MNFRFRQFEVRDQQSTMKVGTDAVLIGSWADIDNDEQVLDVGTGCGIIALMIAQRNQNAHITAIDIDHHSVKEAAYNFAKSPWSDRLRSIEISLQKLGEEIEIKFDHIISNPPFFNGDKRSIYPSRAKSRHTVYLSHDNFLSVSASLCHERGKISVVLPVQIQDNFQEMASVHGLILVRKQLVRHSKQHPYSRVLLEFSKRPRPLLIKSLELYNEDGDLSENFRSVTADFYL